MHQLNILSFPSQIFWTILGFIFMFFIVKNILIPTLNSIVHDRFILEVKYKDKILILQKKISEIEHGYTLFLQGRKEKYHNEIDEINKLHELEKDKINRKYHILYKQEYKKIKAPFFTQEDIDNTVNNIRDII